MHQLLESLPFVNGFECTVRSAVCRGVLDCCTADPVVVDRTLGEYRNMHKCGLDSRTMWGLAVGTSYSWEEINIQQLTLFSHISDCLTQYPRSDYSGFQERKASHISSPQSTKPLPSSLLEHDYSLNATTRLWRGNWISN